MVVPKGKVICEKWFCDSIGPFPWSEDGNRHILIAMESYTRWTVTQAVSDITAETIHKFLTRIVTTFRCFRYLVTDNARAFHSDLLKRLSSSLGYKHFFFTPYHAQSNSVERVNSTLVGMLAQYCSQDQTDWDFQLEACTFAINTLTNRSIRTTPYYLMFQRQPLLPADLPTSESLSSRKNRWQLACKLAEEQTKIVQQYNKSYYDKKRQSVNFEVGDQVLVRQLATKPGKKTKLLPRFLGPYVVERKLSPVNYEIRYSPTKSDILHIQMLKRYYPRDHETVVSLPESIPAEVEDETPPAPPSSPVERPQTSLQY